MNKDKLSLPAMVIALGCSLLVACGGSGDGAVSALSGSAENVGTTLPEADAIVKVGKIGNDIYVETPAEAQRKELAAAGIGVLSETCYAERPQEQPAGVINPFPNFVLYVYEIRQKDLGTSVRLGFEADYPADRFESKSRPCMTDRTPRVHPGRTPESRTP